MNNELDFDRDVEVDIHHLEDEWRKYPRLLQRYCEAEASARLDLDIARDELKATDAEVSLEVRSNPEKFGLDRTTEATISAVVLLDERVQHAQKQVRDLQYTLNQIAGTRASIESKRKALENEVILFTRGYYGDPCVSPAPAPEHEQAAPSPAAQQFHANRTARTRVTRRIRDAIDTPDGAGS